MTRMLTASTSLSAHQSRMMSRAAWPDPSVTQMRCWPSLQVRQYASMGVSLLARTDTRTDASNSSTVSQCTLSHTIGGA